MSDKFKPRDSKPNQRGTKYNQRFASEAEKPPPSKNNKLQFSTDERSGVKSDGGKSATASKKASKLRQDAATTSEKLEKARNKAKGLPDGKNNRAGGNRIAQAGTAAFHRKIGEAEQDNVGVESAHKTEYAAERVYGAGKRTARSVYRFHRERPLRRVAKLEGKSTKLNMKLDYQKAVRENPKLKSNILSRYMQKRRIKKQYAKAANEAKKGAKRAKAAGKATTKALQAVVRVAANPKAWILLLIAVLLFFFISSCMATFTSFMGGANHVLSSTYLADESEITDASALYNEWETDLREWIAGAESDYPGYDEYRYNIGNIGHDPFVLMAYLTAVHQDFTVPAIQGDMWQLFNLQYQLTYTEQIEIRYRTEYYNVTDPVTGIITTHSREVAYNWRILNVRLTSRPLENVITPLMTNEQLAAYTNNMESRGNRQFAGSPTTLDWKSRITSNYGYRIHPISGVRQFHNGVDIGLPIGTNLLAVHGGTVTTGNDPDGYGIYVVVENSDGLKSLYAHCDSLLVSTGQTVRQGDIIARSGNSGSSTGPHLHLEISVNGQRVNPVYFLEGG